MRAERYARLQSLFDAAVELEEEERRAFLDRACADDPTLRDDVERLLAQEAAGGAADIEREAGLGQELLARAAGCVEADSGARPFAAPPERIGQYRIVRELASGGMGTVYLAEQEHPRRKVALKLIRSTVVSEEMRRRFAFEAEVLGRLQHPGIAQVYEAGELMTAGGRQPYFAMEYVDGVDLLRFVERHELGLVARLELLVEICEAVNHAHQKGIVHRDLKPGNILVVEEPTTSTAGPRLRGRPVVLDFGVSRLADQGAVEATRLTRTGHVVGTLAYMSPEQAAGEATVDTRSDVYSLGVIAYRLLSGRLPHDLSDQRLLRALQTIQLRAAPRLDSLDGRFRGDLSIIVGKALELEPERRYASAAVLADDLRRYLADQPITARQPTLRYQLGRLVRRNRSLVIAAALALLCLVAGLVMALRSQREEARQRIVAEQRTEDARRTAYAAQLQAASAYRASGDDQAARSQLALTESTLRGFEWQYLSAALDHDLRYLPMTVPERPWGGIAPGETRALIGGDEHTLRLLDCSTMTWRDVACERPRSRRAMAVALLPGRNEALLGDLAGNLELVDLDGRRAARTVWQVEDHIGSIHVLPDGRHVLVSHWARSVPEASGAGLHVLDLETFAVVAQSSGLPRLYRLGISPDGRRVAVPTDTGEIRILGLPGLEHVKSVRGHKGWVSAVRFSPSGREFASSGLDRTVRLWSMDSSEARAVFGPVRTLAWDLAFHPDGVTLLTAHGDALVRRWNTTTGACQTLSAEGSSSNPDARTIWQLVVSEDGERAVAIAFDGVYERALRDPAPSVLHHETQQYSFVYDVEFDPAGRRLASAGWDGFVRLWDVATGRPVAALPNPNFACWVRYSPDGKRLMIAAEEGWTTHFLRLWDSATLSQERELWFVAQRPCGLYLPDGSFLLACDPTFGPAGDPDGVDHALWVLDPDTLTRRREIVMPAPVWGLALGPDGSSLACGMEHGQLWILDARSLEIRRKIEAHAGAIEVLAYSPDGLRLASGGADSEVKVWDVAAGAELLRFPTPGARNLMALQFTPDGRRILTGSRRVSIGVFAADTGSELVRLAGHGDYVRDLVLRPDGRVLASASGDGTVRVWDCRPLRERFAAREELLRLEAAVRARVEALVEESGSPAAAMKALDVTPGLSAAERYAARNVLQIGLARRRAPSVR